MFSEFLQLFFLTLVPWIELRGSIPYGIALGLNPILVLLFCIVVNILLLLPLFFFLDHLFPFIRHWAIIDKIVMRVQAKSEKYVDRWGFVGLALFVGVPLPGSGVYSGALAAYLLGIPKKKAFQAIVLGVAIAGVVVFLGSLLIKSTLL